MTSQRLTVKKKKKFSRKRRKSRKSRRSENPLESLLSLEDEAPDRSVDRTDLPNDELDDLSERDYGSKPHKLFKGKYQDQREYQNKSSSRHEYDQ